MNIIELKDICEIKNGYAFKSQDYKNEGIPLIRISNFDDNEVYLNGNTIYLDSQYLKTKSEFIVEKGDVLIALSGATTGKFGIYNYEYPSLLNQRIGLLKSGTSKKLYTKYFYYYLSILKGEILRNAGGAAQPNISTKAIGNFKIPLPPLEIQKKIASILDAADDYRQKTRAVIEKYDQLAQALFLDMFGDPVKNEKRWKVNKLKSIATKILSGNTPKGGSEVYVNEGIAFFRSQNVWRNRLELEDIAYISKDTHDKMSKSSLKYRDILMTKTGRINTENSSLGRAAIFLGDNDTANINGHVYLIRLKKDVINEFVLFVLTTDQYREHIRRVCVGGIDKRQINKEHLEEFPIISPPIDLQQKFTDSILSIEGQKQQVQASLLKAEELFNSLLQKAFKGELV
jgi:restriction endonuclease S subunit